MKHNIDFGAVYFRKSAPPQEDWERDYETAAADGHTMFRHWFSWNAIEVEPGVFDWSDYDKQLELAARFGIDTVIAEMLVDTPEWLYAQVPDARIEQADGTRRRSGMHGSSATGGHYCLCLDHQTVENAAERFLTELVLRYKNHPALVGYDIWNENTLYSPDRLCYCSATQEKFRLWLKAKYGDIKTLGRTWRRYSLTDWNQVELPRTFELYPETFDAIRFWNDQAFAWMRWRANLIRRLDPGHSVIAHGNARSFNDIAPCCGDDFRGAGTADIYGYTYYYGIACHPMLAGDLIRSASNGKRFWRAEAIGNSTWLDRKATEPANPAKDRMSDPSEIRLDLMISLAAGARGYLNPRWRPLLDGPLFNAFGWYGMDGSRTERSEMASKLAKWCNAAEMDPVWQTVPLRGEAAILILEDAQTFSFIMNGTKDHYCHYYSLCTQGIYEALLDSNIQCDFTKLEGLDRYDLVYVPFPLALSGKAMDRIRQWIANGGTLITEGCFGYFDELGHAWPKQPNRGFDEVFGCREKEVSFGADRWNDLKVSGLDSIFRGGMYKQSYTVTSGKPSAWYEDGSIAAVDHSHGKGKIRIIGTMPGYGYKRKRDEATRRWIVSGLAYSGKKQRIKADRSNVIARIWEGNGYQCIWVINQNNVDVTVTLTINMEEPLNPLTVTSVRGEKPMQISGTDIKLEVGGRDASILLL